MVVRVFFLLFECYAFFEMSLFEAVGVIRQVQEERDAHTANTAFPDNIRLLILLHPSEDERVVQEYFSIIRALFPTNDFYFSTVHRLLNPYFK